MKHIRNEKGAIMVEATIYIPLVICTVMALIYLALFNMQEYMMMYEAQRVAAVAAREAAYSGYENFGMGSDNEIDFSWGSANYPSENEITEYYKAHHSEIKELYREISGILSSFTGFSNLTQDYERRFADAARNATLIAMTQVSSPEVDIKKGLLGTHVTVTFTHSLPTPGVMQYLGLADNFEIRSTAYTYSGNPAGFVRNVDLSVDLVSYILEKFGMADQMNTFLDKTKIVLEKIL